MINTSAHAISTYGVNRRKTDELPGLKKRMLLNTAVNIIVSRRIYTSRYQSSSTQYPAPIICNGENRGDFETREINPKNRKRVKMISWKNGIPISMQKILKSDKVIVL